MNETALIDEPQVMRGGPMKFAYASGARPLEGYTIKRGIGIGGFGEVYFATTDAGKEVALKRIQRNLDVELRGVSQCLNLKHQNLVALFDIRYDDHGQGWVVMEYVAGESLRDVIERNPNGMPIDEVHEWFSSIAAGVTYLHDHGIVHRDLKPGNIFADDGVVKIGDYGLSKFISTSRRSGQTESVGTFHYMAPEIGRGVYGKEIDVYALGIILFEMLTGRVPFEGESSQEIIMKHLTDDPDLSGVAPQYQAVIAKALTKDPDHRYSNVGDMNADLQSGSDVGLVTLERAKALPALVVNVAAKEKVSPAAKVVPNLVLPGNGAVPAANAHLPPVVTPARAVVSPEDGMLYITDELPVPEIEFGPVVQKSPPLVVPPRPVPVRNGVAQPRAVQTNRAVAAAPTRSAFGRMADWFNHNHVGTAVKLLALVFVGGLLLVNANWAIPVALVFGAVYLAYFGVKSLISAMSDSGPPAPSVNPVVVPAGRRDPAGTANRTKKSKRRTRHEAARHLLAQKKSSEKFTELTGSLLLSALVASVLSLLALVISGQSFDGSVATWSQYGWLTLCGTLGAWSVLALSKFWEGRDGEQIGRRFVMLVAGMVAGGLFFGASQVLMVNPHNSTAAAWSVSTIDAGQRLLPSLYSADGAPLVGAYLAYFAGLFVALRWWKQADPLRTSRVSFWGVGACVLWAYVLNMFWHFPQPWGVLLAAVISVSVQLSAPWMKPQDRAKATEQLVEA
jgi:hypothetical protein